MLLSMHKKQIYSVNGISLLYILSLSATWNQFQVELSKGQDEMNACKFGKKLD